MCSTHRLTWKGMGTKGFLIRTRMETRNRGGAWSPANRRSLECGAGIGRPVWVQLSMSGCAKKPWALCPVPLHPGSLFLCLPWPSPPPPHLLPAFFLAVFWALFPPSTTQPSVSSSSPCAGTQAPLAPTSTPCGALVACHGLLLCSWVLGPPQPSH